MLVVMIYFTGTFSALVHPSYILRRKNLFTLAFRPPALGRRGADRRAAAAPGQPATVCTAVESTDSWVFVCVRLHHAAII